MKVAAPMLALLLSACSATEQSQPSETAASLPDGLWMADERSGLCKAGEEAAYVIHAADGSNCMAQGAIEQGETGLSFRPRGDANCTVPISMDGEGLVIGSGADACDYYCAGSASLPSPLLRSAGENRAILKDGGGDPICPD
ncbi:hypothetical protein [Sphingomicrobium lutaoense]|uniref:Lipoprotein n=1 Tax=Sphingomicrobium lutaoense TaxID=515949 RepID=A0A839YXT3_9SPHN|nr:hypothetical protein [Sphingomicrobium lutaoense]MBB3763290.1 hypothetical protein [Sphingomicrobium lutaoense]